MSETRPEDYKLAMSSATPPRRSNAIRLLGGLFVLALLVAALGYGLMRFLAPQQRFEPFVLPYIEEFADVDVKHWFTDSGVWSIREESLTQVTNLDKPAQIFMPYELGADLPYHLSVYLAFSQRTQEVGVNFNAQYSSLSSHTHRVYLARRTAGDEADKTAEEDMELVAGYMDGIGNFVPQVTVPFRAEAQNYRLDLYVLGNTYLVQLNGQTLIEKRPTFYSNGLVGFYSLGPATFDTLKLSVAQDQLPGDLVYVGNFDQESGGAGWVPFAGDWSISDGEMVQADPSAQNTGIGYEGSAFENYVLQSTLSHLVGVGGGLLFNMPSPYQINGAHVVRFSEQADALFWGYFDEAGTFIRQGFTDIEFPATDFHQLKIYVYDKSYDVYLDDRVLAQHIELQRSNGHIGLTTSMSSVGYTLVEVFPLFAGTPVAQVETVTAADATPQAQAAETTPTPSPVPTARPTVAIPAATPINEASAIVVEKGATAGQGRFAGTLEDSDWQPISGRWSFRDGSLLQENSTGFDQAIVYTEDAFRNYSFEVAITHVEGNGAGLLFNMPFRDRLQGAHMVRYSDRRPGGVFWGYYDADGKFIGQGYGTVDAPSDQRHVLRVISTDTTYSILLDGVLLVDALPLQQNYGYVGIVTNLSSAAFDSAQVTNAADVTAGLPITASGVLTSNHGNEEPFIVNGSWELADQTYVQTLSEPTDYLLNTGVYSSSYSVEAIIVLSDKPEVGAGFIIHMPERDQKVGAYMVRLIDGGESVFWGSFDASGAFQGKAMGELALNPNGIYRLRLDVQGNTMDIIVNDQQVASGVRLPRSEGWISLLAFGGPVTFTNVTFAGERTSE